MLDRLLQPLCIIDCGNRSLQPVQRRKRTMKDTGFSHGRHHNIAAGESKSGIIKWRKIK